MNYAVLARALRGGESLNKYDYFEYEGDIPSWYGVLDTIKELTREFKSVNDEELSPDIDETQESLRPEAENIVASEEPEAQLLPDEPEAQTPVDETEPQTPTDEPTEEHAYLTPEEISDAVRAFEEEYHIHRDEAREVPPEEIKPAVEAAVAPSVAEVAAAAQKRKKKKEKMTLFERLFVKKASRLKRFLITVLMLIFLVVIFAGVVYFVMRSINQENTKIASFNSNAANVCSNLTRQYGNANYENLYNIYNVEGYRLTGLCFVRELDFDEDGQSELMLTYNKNGVYINEVWGADDNGSFNCLFSENAAQTENRADDAYSVLYRSGNKYYIARFGEDVTEMKLCQYKAGKFSEKYDARYNKDTEAFSVEGKDATDEFETIKYSVLDDLKASRMVDTALEKVDSFTVGGVEDEGPVVEQSINTAYYGVVQEYNKRYGVANVAEVNGGRACVDGLAVVKLVDFDGDEKDELVLVYRKTVKVRNENSDGDATLLEEKKYFCDIYRYSGNKAILVYSNEGLSNKADSQSDIYFILQYEGGKVYYCTNSVTSQDYGNHVYGVSTRFKYNGTDFKTDYKSSYETDYGYTHYYLEGAAVSKTTFEKDGCKIPYFYGNDKYDDNVFKITYVQRRSNSKAELLEIPRLTEKEIQKLNQLYTADMIQN